MIVITHDMITSDVIATVMKDHGGHELVDDAEFHAHLEEQLRKDPASTIISQTILAYSLAISVFEKNAEQLDELLKPAVINSNLRFIAIGIAVGMNLSEKLVRDIKLAELVNSAHPPEDKP